MHKDSFEWEVKTMLDDGSDLINQSIERIIQIEDAIRIVKLLKKQ